jgi:hypothetical protein
LWPTVTIHRNGLMGYTLASGLPCVGSRCKNRSSCSFYLCTQCNSLFTNDTNHSKLPDLCGYWQSVTRSICLLSYYQKLSLELCVHSQRCFPCWKLATKQLLVIFWFVQILRRIPSFPSLQVLLSAPKLTSTQRKVHPRFRVWFRLVVAVATGDTHSARHNTSPGVALPTPSRSVDPLHASFGFLCIDTSEICVRLLIPQQEPTSQGK